MTAIRLKQAWKTWSIGHVFTDMPPNQASELIRRGVAETVKPPKGKASASARAAGNYINRAMGQG